MKVKQQTILFLSASMLIGVLTLMVGCYRHGQLYQELVLIDSLSKNHADSALTCLRSLKTQMPFASNEEKAYYRLVFVKAYDRSMHIHQTDSTIMKVVRHYEDDDRMGHLAEAYYYAGRVNVDLGKGEVAYVYFQKALMSDMPHQPLHLKSRIYAQMGYVFLRNGLLKDAIEMQRLALFYSTQNNDTLAMRYCQEDIKTITAMLEAEKNGETDQQVTKMMRFQRLVEKMKNEMLYNKNVQLEKEEARRRTLILLLVTLAVIVIAASGWLLMRARRKIITKKREAERLQRQKESLQLKTESLQQQAEELQQETETLKQKHTACVRQFYDADVEAVINEHLIQDKILSFSDWKYIEERLLLQFPSFKNELYAHYNFSLIEYRICLLIKAGVSPVNMAKLTASTASSISQCRLRMQQKLFNGQGTSKDWDTYILSI